MAGQVDLYMTMLFTYQGMGNLITLTAPGDATDIKYSAMIDFGTTSSDECSETVTFAANFLTNKGAKDAVLDLVAISHKDHDHWLLFDNLIEEIGKLKKKLIIKKLVWGGEYSTYNKSKSTKNNILDRLAAKLETTNNYFYYNAEGSAYAASSPLSEISSYGGVSIKPVAVNVPCTSSKNDIKVNTQSLVVAILYQGTVMILPGDATADTIAYINKLLAAGRADEIKSPVMLSVPHHGALRTIASNFTTTDPKLDVAKKFAETLQAATVGASAGFNSTNKHPDEGVMQLFGKHTSTRPRTHDYVSYFRTDAKWKVTTTDDGLFTTYITVGKDGKKDGAEKRRVVFRIYSNGDFKIALLNLNQAGVI